MAKRIKIFISRDAENSPEKDRLYLWFSKPFIDEEGEWNDPSASIIRQIYNLDRKPEIPDLSHLAPGYGECFEFTLSNRKVLTK